MVSEAGDIDYIHIKKDFQRFWSISICNKRIFLN